MTQLKPFFQEVQAHYDLSDEFFALFLDRSMTYSCAYFERDDMTLGEAQLAKIDLSLGKLDLQPGMRLLDIGCGWGATAIRAAQKYGVNVIGLTLSQNQQRVAAQRAAEVASGAGAIEIRLQGWEEFDEPVDRIVSIGAFEHFRRSRYDAFFERCRRVLPGGTGGAGERMLLHTIVQYDPQALFASGLTITHEDVLFGKFIIKHIFPGGQLPFPQSVIEHGTAAGFQVQKIQPLGPHYARTLDMWAANLQAARETAVALTSQEIYERYMHYLTGCADRFRSGRIDVMQFTLVAA